MPVIFRRQIVDFQVLQRAADLANARARMRNTEWTTQCTLPIAETQGRRPTARIRNISIEGNGMGRAVLALAAGFPGDIELTDVEMGGAMHGIYIEEDQFERQRNRRMSPMKVTVNGGSNINGGHAGVSVANDSNAQIELNDGSTVSGGVYGIEERDAAIARLKAALPSGTPADAIEDAIAEVTKVKDGSDEEKHDAVRRSRLWGWVKENGGDVAALIIKIVNAAT